MAATAAAPTFGPSDLVEVRTVDSLPKASGWAQKPARGGRPNPFSIFKGAARECGTLAPGSSVPSRAGNVFPSADRRARFFRAGGPPPHVFGRSSGSKSARRPRRRGASSFSGDLGRCVCEFHAQSLESRPHGRALYQAVATHRNWRGPASASPMPLGASPPPELGASFAPSAAATALRVVLSYTWWKRTTAPTLKTARKQRAARYSRASFGPGAGPESGDPSRAVGNSFRALSCVGCRRRLSDMRHTDTLISRKAACATVSSGKHSTFSVAFPSPMAPGAMAGACLVKRASRSQPGADPCLRR